MKIKVNWGVSVEEGTRTYQVTDLVSSEEEWNSLSEDEEQSILQKELDNDYNPPAMIVESFQED